MRTISEATIRQFLRTAAVALALGSEAVQAFPLHSGAAAGPSRAKSPATLASDPQSGGQSRFMDPDHELRNRSPAARSESHGSART